ncbi:unnamed protein product, partial [Iphiclides podalirius]
MDPLLMTKVIFNDLVIPNPVTVGNVTIDVVKDYIYLSQKTQLSRDNFNREIDRRIRLFWAKITRPRSIFTSAALNVSEIWTLTGRIANDG